MNKIKLCVALSIITLSSVVKATDTSTGNESNPPADSTNTTQQNLQSNDRPRFWHNHGMYMTPEQREERKKRFENMTPAEMANAESFRGRHGRPHRFGNNVSNPEASSTDTTQQNPQSNDRHRFWHNHGMQMTPEQREVMKAHFEQRFKSMTPSEIADAESFRGKCNRGECGRGERSPNNLENPFKEKRTKMINDRKSNFSQTDQQEYEARLAQIQKMTPEERDAEEFSKMQKRHFYTSNENRTPDEMNKRKEQKDEFLKLCLTKLSPEDGSEFQTLTIKNWHNITESEFKRKKELKEKCFSSMSEEEKQSVPRHHYRWGERNLKSVNDMIPATSNPTE